MVLATSGSSSINFNRIVSSNSHPYHVFSSETLTYTPIIFGAVFSEKLCGLYIKDLNSANVLICDNNVNKVKLANINFQTPKITYQIVLPKIISIKIGGGFFLNEEVFFITANGH
jgi:hypothetical protein